MKSATSTTYKFAKCLKFQSTHSMKSATASTTVLFSDSQISIHALHEECDGSKDNYLANDKAFQSTHSMKSATVMFYNLSIFQLYFNPRTP